MSVVSTMGSDLPLIRRQQTLTLLLVLPPVMSLELKLSWISRNTRGNINTRELFF